MKECDIVLGVKTYSDPPTFFQGVRSQDPLTPQDLHPWYQVYVSFTFLLLGLPFPLAVCC